ncbi:MAG TPA: galactose-1-phosphate uridylyltransferase [Streptosporangiaceae bacterium]|nr:galactose-1-phosphate uridylyltransferase [Streptosporangiaceae bacterium]
MWKSTGKLADGREIVYFDESPGTGRANIRDSRDLPPTSRDAGGPDSGLRWDPLLGEWVVIAAERQERTFLPSAQACPLCPSAPGRLTEVPASDYDVVVFENRFPALRGAGDGGPSVDPSADPGADPGGAEPALAATRPALGRCEVVCFTADHDASFARLTPARARTVVEAWADRTAVLGGLAGVRQVYCFENRGEEIGVTLHHPHGQIYALPFVTPRMRRMLAQAREYAARTGGNLFDDLVAAEVAAGARIVARNEDWTAFVPASARWPYEVWLFPARRVPDLTALDEAARQAFCPLYLDVLRRLDALFAAPLPYIAAWHQAPRDSGAAGGTAGETGRAGFGAHLQVLSVRRAPGKLKYLAGTESGTGVWSNDIVPETAARRLREAG